MKCDSATPVLKRKHDNNCRDNELIDSLRGVGLHTAMGNFMHHICAGLYKHGSPQHVPHEYSSAY